MPRDGPRTPPNGARSSLQQTWYVPEETAHRTRRHEPTPLGPRRSMSEARSPRSLGQEPALGVVPRTGVPWAVRGPSSSVWRDVNYAALYT